MLVLDQENSYAFSNMAIKVTDYTVERDDTTEEVREVPKFNLLIPTVQDVGVTNTLELFYPGDLNVYLKSHGKPNPLKYGFGPDLIHDILALNVPDVGIYTVNLRGESASKANAVVVMKYKVEPNVPYTDTEGNPYYYDANGQLTTSPTDATPIVRNVLHVKFELAHVPNCKKWVDLHKQMNNMYSETPGDDGYMTIPVFAVMYRGASKFGNNVYMSLEPKVAEYDGNMYYSATVFDGVNTTSTSADMSLDLDSGAKYSTSYFIETKFNNQFKNLQMLAFENIDALYEVVNPYLYTLDEFIAGTWTNPAKNFAAVDIFNPNEFALMVDEGSLNMQIANAIQLTEGSDGAETRDELFEKFFKGDIMQDITSVLRYQVHYIPDLGYTAETKRQIIDLVKKRNRMTSATLMIGGNDTIMSALTDHQANYYDNMPNIRQIPAVQSPMMYNQFVRRTVTYPGGYFDTMALMRHIYKYGNAYQPFAGAECRWTGYIEDTMVYPPEVVDIVNSLQTNRINVVMKDGEAGGYLSDQMMNTILTSDQTELNNAFLISSMLYRLLQLVHRNHFKFNEAEEVRMFNEAVNDCVNAEFAPYSASMSVEVYRTGTIGRAKAKNKILVTIDFKDINKYTDIEIVLTDE
jgi:hypothetical protein